MDKMHITNKGNMLNSMENVYIYKEARIGNHINDKYTVKPNKIFDTLIPKDSDGAHITP